METTTETTPSDRVQYRACLDLILGSAIKGDQLTIDKAFQIIDAMNLAMSEAFTRGYDVARENYKTY